MEWRKPEKKNKKTNERNKKTKAENKKTGKSGRKPYAFLAGLLILLITGAVWSGVAIWRDYRDSIISQQKEQMYLTVQSLRDNMEVFIEEYSSDLDGLCQMALRQPGREGNGDEGDSLIPDWNILQEYVDSHSRFVYDIIVEKSGRELMESTKGSQIQDIYSVNRMDAERSFLLAKLDNGKFYLVIRRNLGRDNGIMLVINLETYYAALIKNLRIGSSGYMVLKDAEGIILMHPEPAQWGIEVIEGRMSMYPNLDLDSLSQMIGHQKEGREGVEEYYSYWWMKPGYPRVRKICAYAPVRIGDDFLVLSEVMDYDDVYIPIAEGVLKLVGFLVFIFTVLIAMALYMLYLVFQKQKDTKQIAYLTELNRILEEMHRSEETIAHQQRLQIMGTMTGGIAHEFNNLLTPIMGYADLLMLDLPEDSEQYENALEIYEASAKAKEMIQQISSLSRKNMETAYKNTNAGRMVTRALKMVRSVCPSNVRLEENLQLNDVWILCNETQMNQVILNVCVNAFHAMDHRDGVLQITGTVIDREALDTCRKRSMTKVSGDPAVSAPENWRRYACIDIRDNGCGMSEEILNQIFDPFFTTKKGGRGTGLGLALVEQIVTSHKGYIFAESRLEEGSVFHLCLPVNEQGESLALNKEEKDRPSEGFDRASDDTADVGAREPDGRRLLIVDDNPKVLRLLEKDFSRLNVSLQCCMNFEEARTFLDGQGRGEAHDFDALIAEQDISGHSAVDFCMSIQGQWPDLIRIVMTDRVTKEIVEAKQRRIIDGYIDKPVSVPSILEAVKTNLNNL